MDQGNGHEPLERCLENREAFGDERSEDAVPPATGASSAGDAVSVIVFRVRNKWFALRTILFYQVTDGILVHTIPGKTSRHFRGIVNVGGELQLCFSLADILEITEPAEVIPEGKNSPRLVVVGDEEKRFAFPVDEIMGVHAIFAADREATSSTPAECGAHLCRRILSVEGKQVGLLDEDKLLSALAGSLGTDGNGTGK